MVVARSDGSAMRGKGRQFVPHGQKVMLALPGGAGYGDPQSRDREAVKRDLARGYISEGAAREKYGLNQSEISGVLDAVRRGETG